MSAQAIELSQDWLHLTADDLDCPPRWGTARNPDRATYGPNVAEISAEFGKPFQPWQHYLANTALEIDPVTGLLVYETVIVTLPRQQGKTCITISLMSWRAMSRPLQTIVYAAQTRTAALEKLRDDHEPTLARSVYSDRYEPSWATNAEKLRFDNGSIWGIQATTKTAGHGPTLDLGVLDEGWSQVDNRVDQAWLPAMMTRDSQMWLPSTMGTDASTYFNGKVDTGREAVDAGVQEGIAYFEWSAETDADPNDPATWRSCMPALGHTVTESKIRSAQMTLADQPGEFARAYCNIKQGDVKQLSLINMKHFETLAKPRSRVQAPFAFGIEISHDRAWWSAAVVGMRPDELMHCEIVMHSTNLELIVPWLKKRVKRWRPCGVGIDFGGQAGSLKVDLANEKFKIWTPELQERDPEEAAASMLTVLDMREVAQASGEMFSAIVQGKIVWLGAGQSPLSKAVAGAKTRPLGEAWAWARRGNSVITPLVALTFARWVYLTRAHLYDQANYAVSDSVW